MQTVPKSMRLHLGIFGRTNVGKSTFLNFLVDQDVAIASSQPGTTTDVVEKSMELLPLGPVVLHDTAGLDDESALGHLRTEKTRAVFARVDLLILLIQPNQWGEIEEFIYQTALGKKKPLLVVSSHYDISPLSPQFRAEMATRRLHLLTCNALDRGGRDAFLTEFTATIATNNLLPITEPKLLGDLLGQFSRVVMIVPIDLQAPKHRLILPQVQAIRDALDHGAMITVVKEDRYADCLQEFSRLPDLVVCDSQVVDLMVAQTPEELACTTFSILFSRLKGDMAQMLAGAEAIDQLIDGDKVLIAEACTHHATEDDIGRVKIPRWLRKYSGKKVEIDVFSGRDFPENLEDYKLIIHCGSCMLNRQETLSRLEKAGELGIPITNYGMAISLMKGVLPRVTAPFSELVTINSHKRM
ncbi:[FeFe] hydrogenase H-cluster maturation GTPase HydF [Desulfotalea psychrophila]|nr:[FeFe] hydrogenase H-cluster maturation GTPase HydF [Desulfotalea psychrophila]